MADEKDEELDTSFEEEVLGEGLKLITPDKFLEIVKSTVSNVICSCTDASWFGENELELHIGKDVLIFPTKSVTLKKESDYGKATFVVESLPKTEIRKRIRSWYSEIIEDEIEKRVAQRLKSQEK